jgi:hypothetical protein
MPWTLSDSVDDFRAAVGMLLEGRPAEHSVLLTVCERIAEAGPNAFGSEAARFGWWREGDRAPVGGAFLETPPYPTRLSVMPDAAATELAVALGFSVSAVSGPFVAVDPFVEAWKVATSGTSAVRMNQRLYRLGTLTAPSVPGAARRATTDDFGLLVAWYRAFAVELGGPHGDTEGAVNSRLVSGALWLWEDGEHAVSMAGASALLAGMVRVGPVYTPPDQRGRGYASGVTAAASADAIDRGAEQVLLYTDLANPTSNSIYRKLGYAPIADEITVELGCSGAEPTDGS